MMSKTLALAALSLSLVAGGANAGCLGGAAIGAVGGHFAHHHALAGAAAGCVVGHELSVHKKRQREQERAEARQWQAEHAHH
jgi:hypothetical protein